jgi:type II secretory ATPase GspE/PulE/Tfp pilus assembly ATPase PilB-like protein
MKDEFATRVIAYLKGELQGEDQEAFERDMERSHEWRARVEEYRQVLDLLETSSEERIIEIVHIEMIRRAIVDGASDIHVVPTRHLEGSEGGGMVLYFRINGQLHKIATYPGALHPPVVARWKWMSECSLKERRIPQEGRIGVSHRGQDCDLRVTILPALLGERVTAHLLWSPGLPTDLASLGLLSRQVESLQRLICRPSGLVSAAGPAGSGKTTLLYMMLREIQARDPERATILTVEDPVEHRIDGDLVSQIAVHRRAGLTYPAAVRAALRCDPDVLFVGDLADAESAKLSLHAAMTGRRVLTSLNANSAVGGIQRLHEMGLEPATIAQAAAAFISLRLTRKPCPECVSAYEPDPAALQQLGLSRSEDSFRKGVGCDACRQTGYSGRVMLFEVLELDDVVRRRIMEGASMESLWQETLGRGGSLWEDAREKVRQGLTTVEEVARALFDYPFSVGASSPRERRAPSAPSAT